ncbi:MAG: hypothetical protein IJ593_04760 [Lachnospiraceae bacterium]|nr:hypothetical protein [Lachnospiraceae bacterium]
MENHDKIYVGKRYIKQSIDCKYKPNTLDFGIMILAAMFATFLFIAMDTVCFMSSTDIIFRIATVILCILEFVFVCMCMTIECHDYKMQKHQYKKITDDFNNGTYKILKRYIIHKYIKYGDDSSKNYVIVTNDNKDIVVNRYTFDTYNVCDSGYFVYDSDDNATSVTYPENEYHISSELNVQLT